MPTSAPQPAAPWQFGIRGLLGLMFVCGVIAAAWKIAPQGVVLAAGMLAAAIPSRRLAGDLRNGKPVRLRQSAMAVIAWCGLYGVSIGPAVGLLNWLPLDDTAVRWFYSPISWLHEHTFLRAPLEWYVGSWR